MALTTPPTADDIAKLTGAANAMLGNVAGAGYLKDQVAQGVQTGGLKGAGVVARGIATTPLVTAYDALQGAHQNLVDAASPMIGGAMDFVKGLTGYEGSPDAPAKPAEPPTKAEASAASAASKALQASTFSDARFDANNPKGNNGASQSQAPAKDPNGDVTAWNNMTDAFNGVTGNTAAQTEAMKSAGLPAWRTTGAPGQGKTNFDTKTGNAQLINAGYGTMIQGQGSTPVRDTADGTIHNRLNDFSGVGQGTMPAGAAGVFGPGGVPGGAAPTPVAAAQQFFAQAMQDAQAALARGDRISARRIAQTAQEFSPAYGVTADIPYKQTMASVAQRHATVAEGQLNLAALTQMPKADLEVLKNKLITAGRPQDAAIVSRAIAGTALNPTTHSGLYDFVQSVDNPAERTFNDLPPELKKKK